MRRFMKLALVCFLGVSCLCVFGLWFIGFFRSVREADVPGTYLAKTSWGNSTLVLAGDGTLQQTVRIGNGEVKHINGHWKLVGPANGSMSSNITLGPCFNMQHDRKGIYAPVSFSSIDHHGFRGMEIAVDPDWGISFKKQ